MLSLQLAFISRGLYELKSVFAIECFQILQNPLGSKAVVVLLQLSDDAFLCVSDMNLKIKR